MNVGASAPEELGLYFSWGNSPGHAEGSGYDFSQEVYNETPGHAVTANLTLAEDMARQSIGTPWRMPTANEFEELNENCTSIWTSLNGMNGRLFTSNVNGRTLFFPAAGNYSGTSLDSRGSYGAYWSATYDTSASALCLAFGATRVNPKDSNGRQYGFSVRAVAIL